MSKVIIFNGDHLLAKGKGAIAIESYSSTKLTSYVLFFLEHDKNLFNVVNFWEMVLILHLKIRSV